LTAHPLDAMAEQATLGSVIAALGDGLLVLDAQRRVELVNARGEQILGTRAETIVGRGIDDLAAHWNLRDRGPFAVSKMRHHLLRGLPYRNDDAFVVTASGICHVSLVMTPVREGAEQVGAVICLRDITDLKLTEARLRENEELLRRIFRHAPTGMLRLTSDAVVADCNVAFEAMLGYEGQALLGVPAAQLWSAEDAAASQRIVDDLLGGRCQGWQGELSFRHADGSQVWGNASFAHIKGVGSDAPFVVGVVEDATERKHLEVQLRHAQKLESVGRLAAGIAHEINTPVQFISDNVRFLGDAFATLSVAGQGPPPEAGSAEATDLEFLGTEVPAAIRDTLDGVDRVATIVQAMKSFGHPGEAELQPVDVNEVVRTTLVVAANELREVADVVTEYGDVPPVPGWRGDLNQVVLNLLVNAGHAIGDRIAGSAERGTIRVTTRAVSGAVEIAVADTGGGIPEAVRDRIFDPFFTTKEVGRGTGQGLALAYNVVVERHGGELTFDTLLGTGTTFRVRLPR
jgi:two-component system NtrC family sensor kinase